MVEIPFFNQMTDKIVQWLRKGWLIASSAKGEKRQQAKGFLNCLQTLQNVCTTKEQKKASIYRHDREEARIVSLGTVAPAGDDAGWGKKTPKNLILAGVFIAVTLGRINIDRCDQQ